MKRKIFSVLFALVLVLSFSLVTAVPAAANGTTYYVATDGLDTNVGSAESPWLTIQHAIDAASAIAIDTINVAAGTYDENVNVDKSITLTGASSADVTVGGGPTDHVFDVTADSVTISGFTVSSGATAEGGTIVVSVDCNIAGYAGIYLSFGVTDCNIHDNILTGNVYGILLLEAEDTATAGNNTFTSNTATDNWISGIEMQHTYGNTFTSNNADSNTKYGFALDSSRGNTFTGNTANSNGREGFWLKRGQGIVGSNYNTFTDNTANLNTYSGVHMTNLCGDSTYTGNTFDSNDVAGMELGGTAGDAISNLTVNSNTFSGNGIGVKIDAGAIITDVVLRGNSIVGNTDFGVSNVGTGTVDAECNWWSACTGPDDAGSKNPYHAQAATANADKCTTGVDYIPWMIHTDLVSGWNIYSTPIASGTSTGTIGDALDLWTTDSTKFVIGYYFDSSASPQAWASATTATALTPLQAIYVQMSAAATIDVISNTSYTAPPSQTAYAGWNLIGLAQLHNMDTEDALASAYYVAGANNIGYSQVVSPGLGQQAWSAVRGPEIHTDIGGAMLPTEGYWVNMVNQGILAGFTSTPIEELP